MIKDYPPYLDYPKPRKQRTRADKIRQMRDEELAKALYQFGNEPFCHNDPECARMLDTEEGIPECNCISCALRYLQEVVE